MLGGLLAFVPAQAAPPANDAFTAATEVTLPFEASVDVSEATPEFGEPKCYFYKDYDSYSTVWYKVTAPDASPMVATLASSAIRTIIAVHEGPSMKELRELDCDARNPGYASRVGWVPTAGQTYYIRIGGFERDRGVLDLDIYNPDPPPNDERANAMSIPYAEPMEFEHLSMDNIAAGVSDDPKPSCVYSLTGSRSIWYRLDTPAMVSRDFIFHTITYNWYPSITAWEVQGDGGLKELGCTDYRPDRIATKPSTTYLFQIVANYYETGPFGLHLHAALPNDHLSEAMQIDALPFRHSGEAYNATRESFERPSRCNEYSGSSSIWYKYTAPADTVLRYRGEGGTAYLSQVPVTAYAIDHENRLTELGCAQGDGYAEMRSGESVYFQVSPEYFSATFVTFTVEAVDVPMNDSPETPTNIADLVALNSSANSDNRAARLSPGEPSPSCAKANPGGTAWFSFTPAIPGPLSVDSTYANFDGVLAVYDRSRNEVACNDDSAPSKSAVTFQTTLGETYLLSVSGNHRTRGSFSLLLRHAAAPENDAFSRATKIGSLPSAHPISQSLATTEPGEPQPRRECFSTSGNGIYSTVWYEFTPPVDMQLTVALGSVEITPLVTVYTGAGLGGLVQVACTTNATASGVQTLRPPVTFEATGGTTYYFQVGRQTSGSAFYPVVFTLSEAVTAP